MDSEWGAAWHDFLSALAGLPDEEFPREPLAGCLARVAAAQEIVVQAAAERAAGLRPEILEVQRAGRLEEAVREVAARRDPLPAALSWATLCDGHRDWWAAMEDLQEDRDLAAALEPLAPETCRGAAARLRAWRAGRYPEQGLIFHMTAPARWTRRPGREYRHPSLDEEGFIHLTREPEVLEWVAETFYAGEPEPMALLVVDPALLAPEVRWEGEGGRFPHAYGPLNEEAVRDVRLMRRDAGRWRFPWA